MGIFDFFLDVGNYEYRKIGRDSVSGLEVSTAYTSDEGYETALIDANGVHPVERYGFDAKEEAIAGHEKWCKEALTIKKVIKLGGIGGLVDDEEIELIRQIIISQPTK